MGKILNYTELAMTPLRKAALAIAEAALGAIDTTQVIRRTVRYADGILTVAGRAYDLTKLRHLYVVGVGKCAYEAALELERILGSRIADGVVIAPACGPLSFVRGYEGDHPFPSLRNVRATEALVKLLTNATADDLVLAVISGGGSTLLCLPDGTATYEAEVAIVRHLSDRGANIAELNTVRKHLSRARGGFLAAHAYPAPLVALIFSDVPGDQLEFVSSGPTVRDTTTVANARAVLAKYHAEDSCPGIGARLIETPKEERFFERVANILAVSNATALAALRTEAERQGFTATVRDHAFTGEARDLALRFLADLHGTPPRSALCYGGESTVTVMHAGKGGRNQELALSGLREVRDGELLLALATDGRDNTDAAGGICDTMTQEHARTRRLNAEQSLAENASYAFFRASGDAMVTGATGSNVADLVLCLKA